MSDWTGAASTVTAINVTTGAGADRLTLDFANGDILATRTLSFDGGADEDIIEVRGASATDAFGLTEGGASHAGHDSTYANIETVRVVNGQYTVSEDLDGVTLEAGAS